MRSFSRLVILATVAVLCAVAPRAFAQEDVGPDDASPEGSGTDLFLGSASATIPIVAPPGAAGITPRIVIHYRSSYVDDISARTQGHTAGLGWMLDWGPIILREASTSNLKLQLAGTTYPLVLIDGSQNIYHTKDESFLKLQYFPSGDYWILTSKDGTQHRLGYNAESRANGISGAYKYLVDQTSTTSGVAIRYAYVKQTATLSSGQTYDQAVYIDSIAYAYQGGSAIGDLRQVQFFRAARADWTDPGGTTPSYVDKQRLDAIEVRVGGALVRRYQLAFDYSNDRDGSYNWGGGVAGDLTLRSVTTIGADGTSTLPPRTFTYTNNRLGTATNGLGGSVTYTYEHLATTPLNVAWTGTEWAPSTASGNVVGFIFPGSVANTTPVYKACMRLHQQCDFYALEGGGFWYCYNIGACDDYGGSQNLDQFSLSSILGYCPANLPGTIPMYSVCTQPTYYCYVSDATQSWQCTSQVTGCIDWAIGNVPDQWGLSSFLTYAYVSAIDRYRVVSKAVNDGRGTTSTTTYSYTDIALSSDGTEFRGHGQVRASDPLGHFVDTWFKQDDAFKSRPYHVQIRRNDGALMQEIAHTWTAATPYAGATFASLTRTDVSECDGLSACRQSARTFEYDAYGNPTRVYSYGDLAVSADERDRRLEWVVDATAWIHRPSHSVQYDAAGALVRERWLSFDGGAWGTLGGRGLATRVEERLAGVRGTAGNPVSTIAYDGYGNSLSVTDPRGCSNFATYDASQTFVATTTNCVGHITSSQWDARWAAVAQQTDPNNQHTTFTYDAFGRLSTTTGPLDGASQYGTLTRFYLNIGDPTLQRVLTYRTQQHGTGQVRWTDQYFDGLGRTYLGRAQGPNSTIIQSETAFDSRGLVSQTATPHFSTASPVWTQFTYDALGRTTNVHNPDNSNIAKTYARGVVTRTDERGNVRRGTFDVDGQLVQIDELTGSATATTTYLYDGGGSLVRITNALGQWTTIGRDLLGRKTDLVDPNLGHWTYTYDAGGALLTQTDAKGQQLRFGYDLVGRQTTKTYPDNSTVSWTYDDPAVAYSRGRLTRVLHPIVVSTFTYNPLGNVLQTQRLLDGTTYVRSFTYDAEDRVLTDTFPDGETITYAYNEAGWLATINGLLVSTSYNAVGQRLTAQYVNGTTSTVTYDPLMFRPTARSTAAPSGTLQNLSYQYDASGNIVQINDTVATASRTFGYDALDRLVSASGTFGSGQSQIAQTFQYNALGHFVQKGGISYTYGDPAHPGAVTTTSDGQTYTYDANGNMLTGAGRTFVWDADNQLTSVTLGSGGSMTASYDETGTRVKKQTSTGVTSYPFPDYEVDPFGDSTKYLADVAKHSTGQILFYHRDHLGSPHVVSDANGLRVQLVEYDPWGKISREEGAADLTHRFTGELFDREVSLYYYGGRYLDPVLGRFVSPDPFVSRLFDPQSSNRYSYARNNPVVRIDPTGFEDDGASQGFGGQGPTGPTSPVSAGDADSITLPDGATMTFGQNLSVTINPAPAITAAPALADANPGSNFGGTTPGGAVGPGIGSGPGLANVGPAGALGALGSLGLRGLASLAVRAATGILGAIASLLGGDQGPGSPGAPGGNDAAANANDQSTPATPPSPGDPSKSGDPDGEGKKPSRVDKAAQALPKLAQFLRALSNMSRANPLTQAEVDRGLQIARERGLLDSQIRQGPSDLAGHPRGTNPVTQGPHINVTGIHIAVQPGVSPF